MLSQDDLYADIKRYNNDLALYLFKMTVSRIFHGFADGRTRSDAKITQQILKKCIQQYKERVTQYTPEHKLRTVARIEANLKSKTPTEVTA